MVKFLKEVLVQYFSVHLRHIHCTEIKNSAPHTNFYIQVAGQSYYLQLLDDNQMYDVDLQTSCYINSFFKNSNLDLNSKPFKIVKNKLGHPVTEFKNQYWRLFEIPESISSLNKIVDIQDAKKIGQLLGKLHAYTCEVDTEPYQKTLPQPFYVEHIIGDFEFALQITEDPNIEEAHDVIVYLQDRIPFMRSTSQTAQLLFPKKLIHGKAILQNVVVNPQDQVLTYINWDKICVGHYLYDYSLMLKSIAAIQDQDCILTEIPLFSRDLALAAHKGYMYYMENVLTPQELEHLEDYYKMIILLDSMYYLTQFLLGNKKLKAVYYTQNLNRAINQMMLHQSLTQEIYS